MRIKTICPIFTAHRMLTSQPVYWCKYSTPLQFQQTLTLDKQVVASKTIVTESIWHLAFNRDFYMQNRSDVDAFWQKMKQTSDRLLVDVASATNVLKQ
ncbi:hypothetical protein DRW07_04290 [Alteromonas sediminis]|uniref:Uncharacterized protein n=1 Tax=Alteromonas sediminis TaxID=2259342 RepID=A0A3N5ZE81_9ALTE|nr:hypothetical protein [Alteromonas sediminis]RPJ68628.1 hypothetical protein DRW07_04290 [Alteromonas sediminis]